MFIRSLCAGQHAKVGALYCVLAVLLAACHVYDGDATRTGSAGVQTAQDAATSQCPDGQREACNGQDDDCDGRVDEDAAASCMLPHAEAVCRDGACLPARCTDEHRDCDQEPDNGCEVAVDAIEHCGQCQNACSVEHGSPRCQEGRCELDTCEPGYADCDADALSCEVDLTRDVVHCGSCEQRCGFGVESPHAAAVCRKGRCRSDCDEGFGDCDGKLENGCETSLLTDSDCGECRAACQLVHAQSQCVEGSCQLLACEPGYADCNVDSQSCESSLSDVATCGACATPCAFAHAQARCDTTTQGEHSCQFERCDDGWENCDGALDNGCERDTRSIEQGGSGPCSPDPSCSREQLGDRQLFFCSATLTWEEAQEVCHKQRGGELAELRAQTRIFLLSRLSTRVWIGHNNRVAENVWIWANTNEPFWQGSATGRAVDSAYTRWVRGEPNGSGRCGALTANAEMDDLACSTEQPFICELGPDLCPDDPDKFQPGQCGCGVRDTDDNQNGYAECPE